jgi:hypothetical protein
MADAARLDAHANVAAAGLGKVAVDELELAAGGGDLDSLHARDVSERGARAPQR